MQRETMKYCPDCGITLEMRLFDNRQRSFCSQCQRAYHAQLKVGAGALIEQESGLLLLQRTYAPFKGCWNLPAGYVEADESPLEAAIRETFEETGLHVEVERLLDVYFFEDDPRGNGILIVYECRQVGGELRASRETFNPAFFTAGVIPKNLTGGGHDQAILAWKEGLHKR